MLTDDQVEAMCRAHDQEDAAQRGEPSPWGPTECEGSDEFEEFRADRIAAMRVGLSALSSPMPSATELEELAKWHEEEARCWRETRSSSEAGYCDRMAAFHHNAALSLRGGGRHAKI